MKAPRPRFYLSVLAITLLLACGPGFSEEVKEPRPGQKGEPSKKRTWSRAEHERNAAWESLSPEQREKLREALRKVWTDPAVINAREEIKHASDAYQEAIRSAVEKADPSMAGVLAKLQGAGGMGSGGGMGMPGGPGEPGKGTGGSPRGFEEQIRPPGFLESLSPEDREKFRKAETAALESEAVKAAREELTRIREEDEALRRKRLEAHRKLRKVTFEEMVRIDPSIAAMQKRLEGARPPGGNPEKKKTTSPEAEKAPEKAAP